MPVGICPNCNNRFSYQTYEEDHMHTCYGSEVFREEDFPVIEETNYSLQGLANRRGGNTVNLPDQEKIYGLTRRGNRTATHTQRQHYEFIKIPENLERF